MQQRNRFSRLFFKDQLGFIIITIIIIIIIIMIIIVIIVIIIMIIISIMIIRIRIAVENVVIFSIIPSIADHSKSLL